MNILKKHKDKPREFLAAIAYCVSLAWQSSKFYTITRLACGIAAPIANFIIVFLTKRLLDLLTAPQTNNAKQTLIILFLCMLILSFVKLLSARVEQYCKVIHDEILNSKLSLIIIEQGINADVEHFDDNDFYNKLTSASRDSYQFSNVLWNVIHSVSAFISFIMVFAVLLNGNAFYGVILVVSGLPSAVAATRYAKRLYTLTLAQTEGEREKSYVSNLPIEKRYVQDIRLFNAGDFLKDKYIAIWERMFKQRKKSIKLRGVVTGALDCLPEAALVFIGFDISLKILNGSSSVGDYSLYTGLAAQLWSGVYMLSGSLTQIYDNQLRINNFKSIEKIKKRVTNAGEKSLEKVRTIDFENVSFSYPRTNTAALKNVSFSVGDGEKIVFVGLNGSGKSTVIKLLLRFYDADFGEIKINGINIKEYNLSNVRKNFSVYFQDEFNYCFTLRDNIAIADIEAASDKKIEQAFAAALGDEIITKSPKGLNAYLMRFFSNDGLELSGGQHQKVALARTFFRRHTALILDEPSSNLDPKAEHLLFENLKRLTDGKTTIFTSHRLSNVFLADRIIVLESGAVAEVGTQSELLKTGGRYAELYKYQQEKYYENSDN